MRLKAILALVLTAAFPAASAPAASQAFPHMMPIERYLMPRDAEIALARSAAPAAISSHAEIRILAKTGYEPAIAGTNGFVCLVERSWTSPVDDPDFWNPATHAPMCYNAPAVRTALKDTIEKTKLALAGRSNTEIASTVRSELDRKTLPPVERGAMCYMMSKEQFLNTRDGRWVPHLMFFLPLASPAVWGADREGVPLIAFADRDDRTTILMIPVGKWSDGTPRPKPVRH